MKYTEGEEFRLNSPRYADLDDVPTTIPAGELIVIDEVWPTQGSYFVYCPAYECWWVFTADELDKETTHV